MHDRHGHHRQLQLRRAAPLQRPPAGEPDHHGRAADRNVLQWPRLRASQLREERKDEGEREERGGEDRGDNGRLEEGEGEEGSEGGVRRREVMTERQSADAEKATRSGIGNARQLRQPNLL